MPYGSFFNNDIAFKPAKGFADGKAFDIRYRRRTPDFSHYENDYNRILQILKLSDKYMKAFRNIIRKAQRRLMRNADYRTPHPVATST